MVDSIYRQLSWQRTVNRRLACEVLDLRKRLADAGLDARTKALPEHRLDVERIASGGDE